MKRTFLGRALVAVVAASALLTGAANAADPVYTVYACHLPDGTPAPADGFTGSAEGDATVENRCAQGSGLYIGLPDGPVSATSSATWTYKPPADTSIAGMAVTRELHNIGGQGRPSHRYYALGTDSQLAENCGSSTPTECPVQADLTLGDPASTFSVYAMCHFDYNDCVGPEPGIGSVTVMRAAITLKDSTPPNFTAHPTGSLYDPGPVGGSRAVQLSATDEGSGVFAAALVVDGVLEAPQILDTNGGACAKPFTMGSPCKKAALGSLTLDTTRLSDGEHTVAVVVYDATEVNRATSPATTINVVNSASSAASPPTIGGSAALGASTSDALQLRSRQVNRKSIRRPFNRPTTIVGRLIDIVGKPVADGVVTVTTALDVPHSVEHPVGTIKTDALGRFHVEIPPGPSRRVFIRAGTRSWAVRLLVPAPLRLVPSRKKLRNKQKLLLVAYLAGTEAPAASADVAFQVLIGHRWRTFATRPVDSRGRSRVGHRFKVTYQPLTYHFRAIVVGRRTFPFANGTSPPVAVRVN